MSFAISSPFPCQDSCSCFCFLVALTRSPWSCRGAACTTAPRSTSPRPASPPSPGRSVTSPPSLLPDRTLHLSHNFDVMLFWGRATTRWCSPRTSSRPTWWTTTPDRSRAETRGTVCARKKKNNSRTACFFVCTYLTSGIEELFQLVLCSYHSLLL